MLLAYLRGWITEDTQKQGIRSQLRQEVILSALASELDAAAIAGQSLASAASLPAYGLGREDAIKIASSIYEDLARSQRMREYERVDQVNRGTRKAPTIDGLFKLYQALLDAGVIPKAK